MSQQDDYNELGVREERSGWRDQRISARHRTWGANCPAADIDFLLVEYNHGMPVMLVEYKLHSAKRPDPAQATYRALAALCNGYWQGPLPFCVVFYWPDIWAFRIMPINPAAREHFAADEMLTERRFVERLYRLRRMTLAKELEGKLSELLPTESTT